MDDAIKKLLDQIEKKEYDYSDLQSKFDMAILYLNALNQKNLELNSTIKKLEEELIKKEYEILKLTEKKKSVKKL
jgi:hypothetical protein